MEIPSENATKSSLSDSGLILTSDTDSFIIGQRVWVGGSRPGHIAYIGETHFAPGEWAGVVLDEPIGKNDGCVSGKRYFQCETKKGIFTRLTRLTHEPLQGAIVSSRENSPIQNPSLKTPERSRTVSPTSSVRSGVIKSPRKQRLTIGDRVIVSSGFGSKTGTLKYIGETKFAQGIWCGVQLDEPSGKNDGSVDNIRYFECPSKYGLFAPVTKVSLSPMSKRTRMCRSGSKESLSSNVTLNSIATTNTSRLRMGVCGQDVIREKQSHIEQLIKERELDREDSQNQTILFQKTINELQANINDLEKKLTKKRGIVEELQTNFEEATFCSEELIAQNQEYKEKIMELEIELQKRHEHEEMGSVSKQENRKVRSELCQSLDNTNVDNENVLFSVKECLFKNIDFEQFSDLLNLQVEVTSIRCAKNMLETEIDTSTAQLKESSQLSIRLKTELESLAEKLESPELRNQQLFDCKNSRSDIIVTLEENLKALHKNIILKNKDIKEKLCLLNSQIAKNESRIQLVVVEHKLKNISELQKKIKETNLESKNRSQLILNELQNEQIILLKENDEKQIEIMKISQKLKDVQRELYNLKKKIKKSLIIFEEKHINLMIKKTLDYSEAISKACENKVKEEKRSLFQICQEQSDEIRNLKLRIERLQTQFDVCNEQKQYEVNSLKKKLDIIESKSDNETTNFSQKIEEKENEIESLKNIIQDNYLKLSNLEKEYAAVFTEKDSLIHSLQVTNTLLKTEIKNISLQLDNATKERENKTKILEEKIKQLQQEFDSTISELTTKSNLKYSELVLAHNKLEQTHTDLIEKKNSLVKENKQKEEYIVSLESIVTKYKQELTELSHEKQEEFKSLQKVINELQMELNEKCVLLAEKSEIEIRFQQLLTDNLSKEKAIISLQQILKLIKAGYTKKHQQMIKQVAKNQNKVILLQKILEISQLNFNEQKILLEVTSAQFDHQLRNVECENQQLINDNCVKLEEINTLNSDYLQLPIEYTTETETLYISVDEDSKNTTKLLLENSETEMMYSKVASGKNLAIEPYGLNVKQPEKEQVTKTHLMYVHKNKLLHVCNENTQKVENLNQTEMEAILQERYNHLYAKKIDTERQLKLLNEEYLNLLHESKSEIMNLETIHNDLQVLLSEQKEYLSNMESENYDSLENFDEVDCSHQKELEEYDYLSLKQCSVQELKMLKLKEVEFATQIFQEEEEAESKKYINIESELIHQLEYHQKEKRKIIEKLEKVSSMRQQLRTVLDGFQDELIKRNEETLDFKLEKLEFFKRSNHIENIENLDAEKKSPLLILDNDHTKCNKIINQLQENLKLQSFILNNLKKKRGRFESQKIAETQYKNNLNHGSLQSELFDKSCDSKNNKADEYEAQINFLNSIIADMQIKNQNLKSRIHVLESSQVNYSDLTLLKNIVKRKPAARLFCDICDIFDAHDTEDCLLQCSDSPPLSVSSNKNTSDSENNGIKPRNYCEACGVFGHDTDECLDGKIF